MDPFCLTMPEPPPDRRPYEYTRDGGSTWNGLGRADLTAWLETWSVYPDEDAQRVADGHTVTLIDHQYGGTRHVRKRPTPQQRADAARQPALF